jgi:hypothetical protein
LDVVPQVQQVSLIGNVWNLINSSYT